MKLKEKFNRLTPEKRLYKLTRPIIGLTGGIATGKSTVAKLLQQKGLSIINADQLVKDIYGRRETKEFIRQNFPDVFENDVIQFPRLRERVFNDAQVKGQVEDFIYQRLPGAFERALKAFADDAVIVYDVPLLFEKKLEGLFDVKVLVYAPRKIQLARLIKRDGHLEDLAEKILDQQIDIEDKRAKSDFIIDNSQTEAELTEELNQFIRQLFD